MDILKSVGLILLSLSILVTIHELGHYWAARIFKMRVEIFSLFFGPRLFGFKKGDTDWRISLIPLGGYVKISGMMDESMDKEQLAQPPQPWEFRSKPRWQRLIVMLGGIIMNIVLGFILFTFIKFHYGDTYLPIKSIPQGLEVVEGTSLYDVGFRTGDQLVSYKGDKIEYFEEASNPQLLVDRNKRYGVIRDGKEIEIPMPNDFMKTWQSEGSGELFRVNWEPHLMVVDSLEDSTGKMILTPAFKAGLKTGDLVKTVDSLPVKYFSDLRAAMKNHAGMPAVLGIERDGKLMDISVTPDERGKIMVYPMPDTSKLVHIDYSLGEALIAGPKTGMVQLVRQVKSLIMLGSGNANVKKSVSGPVKIADTLKRSVDAAGFKAFWVITAMLSMVLAVMNLLPIPALDGGHVVFLLIEMIIRRDIKEKIKERAIQIGFFLVLALIILIVFKDSIELALGI